MLLRPVALPDDGPALDRLLELIELADGHRAIGEHKYLGLLSGRLAAGVVVEEEGLLVAFAALRRTRQPGTWVTELAVHPLHRRRRLIGDLVKAATDVVAAQNASAVRAWAFQPLIAETLLDFGFRLERELRQLRRPLPLDAAVVPPQGVIIQSFRVGLDEAAWLKVNNAAFAGHPENGDWDIAALAERMHQPWFDPALFRMAWQAGRLVGFCWTKLHDQQVGEIYVVAVAPSAQGRSLGAVLVADGFAALHAASAITGMLYVDSANPGALRLYDRLGFHLNHVDRSFVYRF